MLSRNGRQLAVNCGNGSSIAESHFFDVFYQWSRVECTGFGQRGSTRSIHTRSTRTTPPSLLYPRSAHSLSQSHHDSSPFSTSTTPETSDSMRQKKLRDKVRRIMRSVPNPVVVLTTTAGADVTGTTLDTDAVLDRSLYRGMTLSSFTTLSMERQPLITFNIRFPSRTLSALTRTRFFALHILEASPEGAALAAGFTKGNAVLPSQGTEVVNRVFEDVAKKGELRDAPMRLHRGTDVVHCYLPQLTSKGVKHTLKCRVLGEIDRAGGGLIRIGDHVLVIAKVVKASNHEAHMEQEEWEELKRSGGSADEVMEREKRPALCYAFGEYGSFEKTGAEGVESEKVDE